jgi:hypothetical protein
LLQRLPLSDRHLDHAKDTLFLLVFAMVILKEHPQDAQQHQDARNRIHDVERVLIAKRFVAGSHTCTVK